jgi:zinc protease
MKKNPAAALALVLSLGGAPPAGPGIPARPEQLRLEPLRFDVPDPASLRRLAGNVPVYVVEDHTLPLADVTVFLRAGAYLDPPGKEGLAAMTAALARRGVEAKAESLAAQIDSAARDDYATVSLNCLSGRLDESLDLLFEMLSRPALAPEAVEAEKRRVEAVMGSRNDDAGRILDREWAWLLHGREHVAGRYTTAPAISAITREDVSGFHARFWTPANMIVAVSGDVDAAAVMKRLRRLAGWEAGPPAPWPPEMPSHVPPAGLFYVDRSAPQAQVAVGRPGLSWAGAWEARDRYAASVANQILGGGGFSSRLMQRLRTEQGLVYGVSSTFGIGPLRTEPFQIRFAADPAKVPQAVGIVLSELRRLGEEPVAASELEVAKSQLLAQMADAFGSSRKTAAVFALDEVLGRPHDYWRGYRDRLLAVTAADVRDAARRQMSPETMLVLVVGSWEKVAAGDAEGTLPSPPRQLPLRDPRTLTP